MSCLEDSILEHSSSGPYLPSVPISMMFPEPWKGDVAVSFMTEHSGVTCPQHFDKLCVSAVIAVGTLGKKKLF